MQSFYDLVPLELIADILSLADPSTSLAAASRSVAALLRRVQLSAGTADDDGIGDPQASSYLRRAWLHRLIFHRLVQPRDIAAALRERHPPHQFALRRNHRISHFALVLRRLRPAVHWFPSPPTQCAAFGEYLVYDGRPAHYSVLSRNESHQLWTLSLLLDSDLVNHLVKRLKLQRRQGILQELLADFATAKSITRYPLPQNQGKETWDPILDLVHLAVFFLRSSNHGMLTLTLAQVSRNVPELLSMTLPLSFWSWFCLDYDLIHHWQQCWFDVLRPFPDGEAQASLTHYLAITAATQWSVPLLEAVCSNLDLAPSAFVTWPHFSTHVLGPMRTSLAHLSCFARPYPVIRWLQQHGLAHSPFTLANRARHYAHFADLHEKWDCTSLDQLERSRNEYARTVVALSFRQDLSNELRRCQQQRVLGVYDYGKLLFGLVRRLPHLDNYVPIIKSGIVALEKPDFAFVVASKLAGSSQNLTQDVADQLVSFMLSIGIDPASFLFKYSKTWSVYYIAPFLMSPNLPVTVDRVSLLNQMLEWLTKPSVDPIDIIGKHRLVARLAADVVGASSDDSTFQLDPSAFCSIQLAIIIACQLLVILRSHIPSILPLPQDPRHLLPLFIKAFREQTCRLDKQNASFSAHLPQAFRLVIRTNIPDQFLGRHPRRNAPSNMVYPRVRAFPCDTQNVEWVIRCLVDELDAELALGMTKWNRYTPDWLWKRALVMPGTLTQQNLTPKAFAGYLRRVCKEGVLHRGDVSAFGAVVPHAVLQSPAVRRVLTQAGIV